MTDRRISAWQNPGLWVSVMALLLTIGLALLTAIWSNLNSIRTAVQAISVSNAEQATKQADFDRRLSAAEARLSKAETDFKDYSFNISTRLAKAEGFYEGRKK